MKEEKLQILLKEINLISKEHKAAKKKDTFNIFKVIRKGHEEVGLHSKFLFELISPLGSHRKKNLFLKLFIEQLGIEFITNDVYVSLESDNIDLLITNRSQAIIIENKIYAEDQPKQLSRYYNIVKGKKFNDIYIVYLSLDGKPPSNQSIQEIPIVFIKKRLLNKSYNKFINTWLSKCIKECATEPALRETIIQYQQLLKQLTMSKEVEERKQLLTLLGKENNMQQASYLVNNWIHMRWHTEMDFWNCFYENLPEQLKSFAIVEEYLFNTKSVDNSIFSSRNRSFDYGIALHLFDYKEESICILIERGQQYLEYGIIIDYTKKKENFLIKDSSFTNYLVKNYPNDYKGNEDSPWIHWKFPKSQINFESFNNSDTLNLANPEKRLVTIKELWKEISEYIETVMKWDEIPIIE
jgi:hypothetical protein